jgi:outer membrane biosynthesis protein TonB
MLGVHLSTFIPIVISFVAVGALFYYFNNRITILEKSLIRQNQVLADFIANVRKQVQQPENSDNKVSDSKIAVSDDENEEHLEIEETDEDSDDDTEDSDTDDDSDDDSDADEEDQEDEEQQEEQREGQEEQHKEQQEEQHEEQHEEEHEEEEQQEEQHEEEHEEEEHEEHEQQDDEEESSSDDSSSDDSNEDENNTDDVSTQLQHTTDVNDTQEYTSDFLVDETRDNTDVNGDLLSDNIEDEVEPVSQKPQQVDVELEVEDISNHSTDKLDSVLDVNVNSNMTLSNITDEMLETLGTDTSLDNSLSTIHHENNSISEINTNELNRYKLDQLKTLANQLGIPNQENIRKMKKQEIINAIKSFRA